MILHMELTLPMVPMLPWWHLLVPMPRVDLMLGRSSISQIFPQRPQANVQVDITLATVFVNSVTLHKYSPNYPFVVLGSVQVQTPLMLSVLLLFLVITFKLAMMEQAIPVHLHVLQEPTRDVLAGLSPALIQ